MTEDLPTSTYLMSLRRRREQREYNSQFSDYLTDAFLGTLSIASSATNRNPAEDAPWEPLPESVEDLLNCALVGYERLLIPCEHYTSIKTAEDVVRSRNHLKSFLNSVGISHDKQYAEYEELFCDILACAIEAGKLKFADTDISCHMDRLRGLVKDLFDVVEQLRVSVKHRNLSDTLEQIFEADAHNVTRQSVWNCIKDVYTCEFSSRYADSSGDQSPSSTFCLPEFPSLQLPYQQ
ncbi:hypothetical protein KJ652_04100 [Patescibacteria group bacterium]|nr:hypothetical protein [Patescibacteria group bacterium]MBU1123748.1 hypothetical protein [Patescibacteria group bacterium]MBU1910829.1 hypothetical protein [Patescibacteria group bacterium]